MTDVESRAASAFYRTDKDFAVLVKPMTREQGGKSYVILADDKGAACAVYRIKVDGFLKRMKRWPKHLINN